MGELTIARQTARAVEIFTPLGDDVLLFHRMTATEELGRLFQCELDLLSQDPNIKLEDLLAQNVTIRLELPQGAIRYFNGFVSRFSQEGTFGDLHAYRATVHPWLWFLTCTADCRIFEKATFPGEMTVPNIIKQVFRDREFTDFEEALSGTYRTWDYCVQYRETDFDFVSRLMEQEGIYYYFKHENGRHTLVLADAVSSHDVLDGYDKIPYYPPDERLRRERDHIYGWSMAQAVQPGSYALNDFDFQRPQANLQVKSVIQRHHARAEMAMYDYPGEYIQTKDGEAYARARIEELQAKYERVQGQANARGLAVGNLFELTNHPRQDQNREYLIVAATYEIESDAYASTSVADAEEGYTCSFTAIDSKQPYRPARTTPKPMVQGPQTATVVGPTGDEIYTDQYGRIKVRFHWDHEEGRADEERSCWIRVAQVWAGSNWGGMHIPRVGQEVIVEFLEGDPDRPIITGRVYNNDNMPPYDLPSQKTQSGLKSRSSMDGNPGNFNEIRFEDLKGSEELSIQAEKDESILVKHDKTENIGHDETMSIGNDRTETVGNNETITIGNNRTESVGANESITVAQNRTRNVGQNEIVSVALTRTHNVGVNEMINVGAAQEVTVGAVQTVTVGAAQMVTIGATQEVTVHGDRTINARTKLSTEVGTDEWRQVNGKRKTTVVQDDTLYVGNNLVIVAGKSVTIQTGEASITMLEDGTIEINGKDIKIGGSKIEAQASTIELEGGQEFKVQAAIIKLN